MLLAAADGAVWLMAVMLLGGGLLGRATIIRMPQYPSQQLGCAVNACDIVALLGGILLFGCIVTK